jgi:GNAT superfamily N-acetyltransferase
MESFEIRQAISADIPYLMKLDHSYSTDHVWQMAFQPSGPDVQVAFHEVRLPRPMRVNYPRDVERLADEWVDRSLVLVTHEQNRPLAYLALAPAPAPDAVWVTDVVVEPTARRQGVGSRMMTEAIHWSQERHRGRLFFEMQSKNYPAIQLARRLGFAFSGYSDYFYTNEDISLFFSLDLR